MLQSFPQDYVFIPDDSNVNLRVLGRMIGNAVPVKLGQAIARSINSHLDDLNLVPTK
ncbi:DNA cytosine methyltransferase [Klebsiella pneumoniae]|nr:DNA cytosine methyltransferase [Klebsiella pneumoniae]